MHERKGDFTSCRRYKSMYVRVRAEIADCTLAFIAYSVISLRKRFSDYETFGDLFRDIRDGLLELTFIERLLPAIADPETRMVLECILRNNQSVKAYKFWFNSVKFEVISQSQLLLRVWETSVKYYNNLLIL